MSRPDGAEPLDPAAILTALGIGGPLVVERVTGGSDTAIWRVRSGDRQYALRVFRAGEEERARQEAAALGLAAAGGLTVPAVERQARWRQRPALLLSWLPGRPLRHACARSPLRAWAYGRDFGQAQARIHAIEPAAEQFGQGWLGHMKGLVDPELLGRLERCERRPTLLHLDYHAHNALAAGRRFSGIIDWANSSLGDARYDLARTRLMLLMDISRERRLGQRAILIAFYHGWQAGYARVSGPLPDLRLFLLWAGCATLLDLEPKLGQPACSWKPRHLKQLRTWMLGWHAQISP